MKILTTICILVIILLVGCSSGTTVEDLVVSTGESSSDSDKELDSDTQGSLFSDRVVHTTSSGEKYIVDPALIRSGGPPKGGIGIDKGIPALDSSNIKFVSVADADAWIEDNELVLALMYDGVVRVYPLQIMVWHELVNDEINGEPILITYCPLCGSGIAYERFVTVDGERTETRFGTSGKLFNSNLIMYDEETDTYWQQIDGLGIVGDLTGNELVEISIDTVTWRDWKVAHPDSHVLSQDTGMTRSYGRDPYGSYYEDSFLIFPVDNENDIIHPKTQIVGIVVNDVYKAYAKEELDGKIDDSVGGVEITVEKFDDGRVVVIDVASGEEIVKEEDFWFAWYAFHPETQLYTIS